MNVCFPILSDEGMKSQVNNHFGSSESFLILDTDTNDFEILKNQDLGHGHGMCSPLKALDGRKIDAVIVGGLGMGALQKLSAMGIKVLKTAADTVEANAKLLSENKLGEIDAESACAGHGTCSHHG